MTRSVLIGFGLILLCAAGGCSYGRASATLRAESLGAEPVYLDEYYATAFFAETESTETSIFLADMPLDKLLVGDVTQGSIVHLDLLWVPKAGDTPMDSSATNVGIRFVVIADGEVGVYGGAGFALIHGKTDGPKLSLTLRDASLTLLDSTGGFVDLLSPARLTGRITASLNEQRTRQIEYAVSQLVTNALGRTRLVEASSPPWWSSSSSSAAWAWNPPGR